MSFFGLNVASQGLFTAKGGLNVTNHNIANAETKGYSRQVAEQKATRPIRAYAGYGMIGTGSEIVSVNQIRNQYFDMKYWSTNKSFGEYDTKTTYIQQLENVFNEMMDTGFSSEFNQLFDALQTLSTNPDSDAYRAALSEIAVGFTKIFNSMDEELRSLQRDLNFGVKTKVEQVNFLADQLASINSQITKLEVNGHKANDLRDQRANLIDELSKVINVEVKEIMEGNQESYKVYINGQLLVDGKDTNKLQVVPRATSNNPEDVADLYDIQWATGQNFYTDDPYLSGELKGYIDLRDGNNGKNVNVNGQTINYKGVPYYIQQLNNFVETFSSAFNGIHSSGSNKNGDQIDFFTYDPDMPARTFTVNALILEDVSNIAVNLDPTQGVENNELLLSLLNLRHDTTMFKQGKPESFMQAIMSEIAVDAKQANAFRTRQEDMLLSITNQRLSFSGVDLNEETMNMLKYQQAYNVAAKMISVMDEIYNVTINGMIK